MNQFDSVYFDKVANRLFSANPIATTNVAVAVAAVVTLTEKCKRMQMMKLNCFSWRNAKSPQFAWNIDFSWLLVLLLWLWFLLLFYSFHWMITESWVRNKIRWPCSMHRENSWDLCTYLNAKYIYWFYPRFKTLVADVYTNWLSKTWILFVSGVRCCVYCIYPFSSFFILVPLHIHNVLCTTWWFLVPSLFKTRTQMYVWVWVCVCLRLSIRFVYLFNVYISFYTVQHIGPMNERNIEHMYTQLHTNMLSSYVWWRQCHKKSKPIRIA